MIALAVLAALLLVETNSLRNSLHWVDHADQVINADRELIKLTIDMQTDVRGFLYTGRIEFLQPYKESVRVIDSEFATLNQLVSDDPQQQARLATIHRHFDEWQQQAEHSIDLRRREPAAPRYGRTWLREQSATQPVAGFGPCGP